MTSHREGSTHQTTRDWLRFGTLALIAVLVAAPGVHFFELLLPSRAAFWLSHGLAVLLLALVVWRWRASRARPAPKRR